MSGQPSPPLGIKLRLLLRGAPQFQTFDEFMAHQRRTERRWLIFGAVALVVLVAMTALVLAGLGVEYGL